MPKASPIQNSFAGGEYSPRVYGRADNERYKQGLSTCLNYVPTVEGPIVRKPGEKYVVDAKDPSKPPRLIPFKFSATQNYILEFGDKYIRFFQNNGQILTSSTNFSVSGSYGQILQNQSVIFDGLTKGFRFNAIRNSFLPQPGEAIYQSSVVSSGSVLELSTPYAWEDLNKIIFAQKQDALYMTHPNYPVAKLIRTGVLSWDLKQVFTQDGPYLPPNSYRSVGDNTNVFLTPLSVLTIAGSAGSSLVQINTGPSYVVRSITQVETSVVRIETAGVHQFNNGDRVVINNIFGADRTNNVWSGASGVPSGIGGAYPGITNSSVNDAFWVAYNVGSSTFDISPAVNTVSYAGIGAGSTAIVAPYLFQLTQGSSGVCWADVQVGSTAASFITNLTTLRSIALYIGPTKYWGHIVGIVHGAQAIVYMGQGQQLPAFNSSVVWQLGTYNLINGFPKACSFHQDRFFLAGARNTPQVIDGSRIGLYEDFSSSNSSGIVADDNAVSFGLTSSDVNQINWLKSDSKGLLGGTLASEWNITPSTNNTAISPTNINASEPSGFGSAEVDAVKAGNAMLYVQSGNRKVRELNYFFQVDNYRSTDLSALSEHITAPGITSLAVQKEPIPIVWMLRSDDSLVSMSYSRDDQTIKAGWARHQFGGRSDSANSPVKVKSIAVIPAPDGTYDQLWTVTQRYINGTNTVQIGYIKKFFDESTDKKYNALYLDAAGTYDSPINISNITIGSAVVSTASAHGFANDDTVRISKVVGLNSSVADIDGYIFNSNFVNEKTFVVTSVATSSFYLKDFSGNFVSSLSYSPYVSGGEVRKLVTTISGITWLKNETVSVLADGQVHPETTINSAGVLVLQYPASIVQIGYKYKSQGKTLRPDAGSGDGSAIGKLKKVTYAAFMLSQVGEFAVGPNFNKLTPLSEVENFIADQSQSDNPQALYSGLTRENLETQHEMDGTICFEQSAPLPGMVQSLTQILETNDV